jgi:hypothetical protein
MMSGDKPTNQSTSSAKLSLFFFIISGKPLPNDRDIGKYQSVTTKGFLVLIYGGLLQNVSVQMIDRFFSISLLL